MSSYTKQRQPFSHDLGDDFMSHITEAN